MADYLFITPSEMKAQTILGGNVDQDKYLFVVADAQLSIIEPLLGTELYDVIVAGATAGTLAGDYATLYTNFVKPITKHAAIASYIKIANFQLANGGLFKNAPEGAEIVDQSEAEELANRYANLADMYILRFQKWICKNTIAEYKLSQDEVNARTGISNKSGWWLGESSGLTEDQLW
jgi:hypothetical protein